MKTNSDGLKKKKNQSPDCYCQSNFTYFMLKDMGQNKFITQCKTPSWETLNNTNLSDKSSLWCEV